jgi:hypothetical protein
MTALEEFKMSKSILESIKSVKESDIRAEAEICLFVLAQSGVEVA